MICLVAATPLTPLSASSFAFDSLQSGLKNIVHARSLALRPPAPVAGHGDGFELDAVHCGFQHFVHTFSLALGPLAPVAGHGSGFELDAVHCSLHYIVHGTSPLRKIVGIFVRLNRTVLDSGIERKWQLQSQLNNVYVSEQEILVSAESTNSAEYC